MNTTTATNQIEHKTVLLSKKGMKELKKSIAQLEHDRQAIRRGLRETDKGMNHDDRFARSELLQRLETLESELVDKQQTIMRAKIIPSRRTRVKVAIGSVVDLIDQKGRLIRYTIVESIEANPSDGRISIASPLGSTLVGKTVKDIVEWKNGLHQNSFQLVDIK